MDFERDSRELERALRGYSPVGYAVEIPEFGGGTIESVLLEAHHRSIYKIRLDKPVAFDTYAKRANIPNEPLTSEEEIREAFNIRRGSLPVDVDEVIGRRMSLRDLRYGDLMNAGCLDLEQRIVCAQSEWSQTYIRKPERGMMVEFVEEHYASTQAEGTGGIRSFPGKVIGTLPKSKNKDGPWPIAYLELFQPIPYYWTPQAINNSAVLPWMHSGQAWTLQQGLYYAIEDYAPELLPLKGRWNPELNESTDEGTFWLEEPIPLEEIRRICEELVPKANQSVKCFLQGLMMFVIPLNVGESGRFHPLRRGSLETYIDEVRVEYDV